MISEKTIKIRLVDASVTGFRHAELSNWTGQAIACPRSRVADLPSWKEVCKVGVYFLIENRYADSRPLAYIGESELVAKRVLQHIQKDFWNEAVMFTSKDDNLTKAHAKYLESVLTESAMKAGRYQIENGNIPTLPNLPRSDRAEMAEFEHNIRMVLGVLGHPVLEPLLQNRTANGPADITSSSIPWTAELKLQINDCTAYGYVTDEGFVLRKGSQFSLNNTESMPGKHAVFKANLASDGGLVEQEGRYVATRDILVTSPSFAATIVAGHTRSGPGNWMTSEGKSLKEIENSRAICLQDPSEQT